MLKTLILETVLPFAIVSIWTRLGVGILMIFFGLGFIATGMENIKTKTAKETGRRRTVNKVLGKSNSYTGRKAVVMGYSNVICGIMLIIGGIVFLIFGPFLAE